MKLGATWWGRCKQKKSEEAIGAGPPSMVLALTVQAEFTLANTSKNRIFPCLPGLRYGTSPPCWPPGRQGVHRRIFA